jgi:hypothetical protein
VWIGYLLESGFEPKRKPTPKERTLILTFFVTCVLNFVSSRDIEFGMQRGAVLTLVVKNLLGGKNNSSRSLRKLQINNFDCVYSY